MAKSAPFLWSETGADGCWLTCPPPVVPSRLKSLVDSLGGTLQRETQRWRLVALDSFDRRLRAADAALVSVAGEVLLFGADGVQRQAAPASDPGTWPAGQVRERVLALCAERRLLPLGELAVTVRGGAVRDASGKVVVQVRLVTLAGRTLLRLDGVRGWPEALDAARRAALAAGLAPRAGDPLLQAIDALDGAYGAPEAMPTFLDPALPALVAVRQLLSAGLARIEALAPGIVADADPGFLHQYRVTLRMVRSVVGSLRETLTEEDAALVKGHLGSLARAGNRLRDLDVQLGDRERFRALVPDALHPGLALLLEAMAAERTTAVAELARWLGGKECASQRKSVAALAGAQSAGRQGPQALVPLAEAARERLWRAYRVIRRHALTVDDATSDEALHELRIRCKRLRYLLDTFGALAAPEHHVALRTDLKHLQAALGDYNDLSVLAHSLLDLARAHADGGADLLLAAGALVAGLDARKRELRGHVVPALHAFSDHAAAMRWRALFKTVVPAST